VTDVALQTSLLLVAGRKSVLGPIDSRRIEAGVFELEGIVSRKKELLPSPAHGLAQVKQSA